MTLLRMKSRVQKFENEVKLLLLVIRERAGNQNSLFYSKYRLADNRELIK